MKCDVAIVGSGLAGLTVALDIADTHHVLVLAKRTLSEGASIQAQGGIAVVLDSIDSIASHIDDTLLAGAGLCDPDAVRVIVEHGRAAIDWLIVAGVSFTRDPHTTLGFHLAHEGGHSHRRIIHANDATGAAVLNTLIERARAHPNITFLENHFAVDLITAPDALTTKQRCLGLYAYDPDNARVFTIAARHTVLATGGAGKVYLYTTNPDTTTGDGIAMAWRAGCRVANMEFMQFHPTCLFHPYAKSFLISEALRGEGALLRLPDGTRFMPEYDARAELAPRDIVARAIDSEIKKHGIDCVYLDITHRSADFLEIHFPTILAHCLEFGIDLRCDPIPVVPAAHYTCGGVMTNLAGCTDLPGLYTVGESAYTGLHGANRLASNSLLECVVMGRAAAAAISTDTHHSTDQIALPEWDEKRVTTADESVLVAHNWDALRRLMWDYVGIVRTDLRLERARHHIAVLRAEIEDFYTRFKISRDLLELRNLVTVAELIVDSARLRHESRGLHFNRDWPHTLDSSHATVLDPLSYKKATVSSPNE